MAADPKAAPLADDLKEFALSLPTTVFPKNFFCALCSRLAIDPYKLLCCNKAICSECQAKLTFPTTCPSCDHSPLEADSCTINKALRNTMRVWLQKQKKKEEAKAVAQAATPPVATTPVPSEAHPNGENQEGITENIEEKSQMAEASGEQSAADGAEASGQRVESATAPTDEDSAPTRDNGNDNQEDDPASQNVNTDADPSAANTAEEAQNGESNTADTQNAGMMGMNPMLMNGMSGQMGFGFPNQAGFNNGMGFGMSNMMNGSNWNSMNSMDFNNMNSMYGNFGGNMSMGMNDMSSMNFGGGFGGWNGMGGGFGNYNGFNQMSGYNQSGTYPEMMNQYPKNNFSNQNQNRFHANQGGAYSHGIMRNGSQGNIGTGLNNAISPPGSQSGPVQNRDGQSPTGAAEPTSDAKANSEQSAGPNESTDEGKTQGENATESGSRPAVGEAIKAVDASGQGNEGADLADTNTNEMLQGSGLKQIQTFDSGDADQDYPQSMSGDRMHGNMAYPGMMNNFDSTTQFNSHMNMGYGNNFGPRGGFNNAGGAYGAAKVLTEQSVQPVGVGVVGAPTGPRAMREGRPNTGFSSRANNARFSQQMPKSVIPAQDAAPNSPQRRVRSRSPFRDDSLRTKERSPSRSRSRSPHKPDRKDDYRERSRSADRETRREERGRSYTSNDRDDHERRREKRPHRSSRYDDRDEEYHDERRGDDRASRGDRTRSTSVESTHRSSRRDKDKYRSSRSHRDRSKEHRRRHRSRSPRDGKHNDEDGYVNGEKESDSSSRKKRRDEKDKYRDRSRDRSRDRDRDRDRKDRKERDREYEYERSREKDKERRRRRDREAEEDERDYEDEKNRSSRRSRKEKDRERSSRYDDREREDRDHKEGRHENSSRAEKEEDVVSRLANKRAASPPPNAPTGPSANGFSIKGRSKSTTMQPPASVPPPSAPRTFQPPKGPAADRRREQDHSESRDHKRKTSTTSVPTAASPRENPRDHYAAERERNARERDSRERVDKAGRDSSTSLHSRMRRSTTPSLSKRSRDDYDDAPEPPRGPKADSKVPSGPSGHRDKRRKSGAGGDDNNIANLFTATLRKKAKARRGGVRTEGDVEREMERVERERERR